MMPYDCTFLLQVLNWCDMLISLTYNIWTSKVLSGFSPKQLICEDKSDSLSSLAICSGDTLIIEEGKKAPRIPLDSYKKSWGSATLGFPMLLYGSNVTRPWAKRGEGGFLLLALPGGGQVPPPDLPLVTIKFGQLFETFVWNKNHLSALFKLFCTLHKFRINKI